MRKIVAAIVVVVVLLLVRQRCSPVDERQDSRTVLSAVAVAQLAWAAQEYAALHGLGLPDAFVQMLQDEPYLKSLPGMLEGYRPIVKNGVPLDGYRNRIRIFQGTDEVLVLWSAGSNGEFQARPGGKHFYDDRLYLISKHGGGEVNLQDIEEAFQNGGRLSQMLKSNPFRDRGRWPGTRPATTTSSP